MYVEKDDFSHHRQELDTLFAVFDSRQIQFQADTVVLDVGAGQGMHAGFLAQRFKKVYCTDIIPYNTLYEGDFIRLLHEKYLRNDLDVSMNRLCFIESCATDLIFRNAYFDLVISINTFEHFASPRAALVELVRVTKPGGYIYISFDPLWPADTGSHFFHRVSKPWTHLLLDTATYCEEMARNGATAGEIADFCHGVNKLRPQFYRQMFEEIVSACGLRLIEHSTWSGLTDEQHRSHAHFHAARALGYCEEELLLRGMRYVLQKGE
jgi:ubiquinone/menaquinone biosynthesis C-methylase UbiE